MCNIFRQISTLVTLEFPQEILKYQCPEIQIQ